MSDVFPTSPSIGQTANGRIWDGFRWNCPALLIDAPADGNLWGRMNNTWQRALPFNGGELLDLLIDYDLLVLGNATINGTLASPAGGIVDFGGQTNILNLAVTNNLSVANTAYFNSIWLSSATASTGFLVDNGYLVATGGILSAPAGAANSFGFWQGPGTNTMAFGFGTPTGTPTTDIMNLDINGNLSIAGTLTQGSDARMKEYVGDYVGGLDIVRQLQPRHFHWKNRSTGRQIGLIAQEVSKVLPEAVHEAVGMMGIMELPIIAVLINAVKGLAAKVEALDGRISEINREPHHGDIGHRRPSHRDKDRSAE